jgi:hypothetical protein
MDPFARHCGQCPILAREYDSWQAMVNATGGVLPGMGTDCDGNCRCHLEMLVGGLWVWM